MKKLLNKIILFILIASTLLSSGCVYDPWESNVTTRSLDPISDSTYSVGSLGNEYLNGYFDNLNVGGSGVVSAGANLADNTIIRGDGGVYGIQDSGVTIDDFDNINTNGGDITGFDINADNDVNVTNDLEVTDHATIGDGLDMTASNITDILKLNMTDPTELTISSGNITITQGFHTVDTEGDAASDYLDYINGGAIGDILTISGASDTREVVIRRTGNIRFKTNHMLESFSFASPSGSAGIFYTGGYYAAPATSTTRTQAAPTITYGTANSPYGAHAFIVAGGAGTTDAGTVSLVVSGTSIAEDGTRTPADSETIVADITTMVLNDYYQTDKSWLGTVTYTLVPVGATTYSATFNYGRAAYDSFDRRIHTVKLFEIMGRAGANDVGFDIQLLHHEQTGWTYSLAAFMPGTTPVCSLATDYGADNDLVAGERFKYAREVSEFVDGIDGEGILVRVITTANKAVEFMDISVYVEAIPNDQHLANTNQSLSLLYNGTVWMER